MNPPTTKTFYINYFDEINAPKIKALMAICSDIVAQQKPDTLYFLFASGGGNVDSGIVFHNFLRALPVEVVMHNMGAIDSIATTIFLAGHKRYAAVHSSFLFHGITWDFPQAVSLTRYKVTETLSGLKLAEDKIASIYTERSKLTTAEINGLFTQGETKDLAFAQEKGIIHEIKNPSIPKDNPFISVNLN